MKTALIIILLVVSVLLSIIVMMQEGKGGGLTSSLSGGSETYWSKNKGKSKEARLRKVTVVLGVLYMFIALALSSKFIK
ncbi:MAG: preprotein translocase subunit SecG [Wujia sp.]